MGRDAAKLSRVLTLADLTLMSVGAIVGAGIFVITGEAAKEVAGPGIMFSYLLSSVAAVFAALCYAEFAVNMPIAGTAYIYVREAFGELPAFCVAACLVLEYTVAASAVAVGWAGYLAVLVESAGAELPEVLYDKQAGVLDISIFALLIIVAIGSLLIRGVKQSSNVNVVVTGMSLACIVFVICAGLPEVDSGNYAIALADVPNEFRDDAGDGGLLPWGGSGMFTGASVVFFAYVGFDGAAAAAEEAVNPRRDLPRAIVGSLAICTVLYVAMAAVIVGMVPYYEIDADAPFADAFERAGMDWAATIVSLGALAGITTSLLVSLLAQPRMWVAVARDGLVPDWFAQLHPRYNTPANATAFTIATSGLLALLCSIDTLAELVSVGSLTVFLGVCLAVLWQRYRPPPSARSARERRELEGLLTAMTLCAFAMSGSVAAGLNWVAPLLLGCAFTAPVLLLAGKPQYTVPEHFHVPLAPVVPAAGVLSCAVLIGSLRGTTIVVFLCFMAAAVGFYYAWSKPHGRRRRADSGVFQPDEADFGPAGGGAGSADAAGSGGEEDEFEDDIEDESAGLLAGGGRADEPFMHVPAAGVDIEGVLSVPESKA